MYKQNSAKTGNFGVFSNKRNGKTQGHNQYGGSFEVINGEKSTKFVDIINRAK